MVDGASQSKWPGDDHQQSISEMDLRHHKGSSDPYTNLLRRYQRGILLMRKVRLREFKRLVLNYTVNKWHHNCHSHLFYHISLHLPSFAFTSECGDAFLIFRLKINISTELYICLRQLEGIGFISDIHMWVFRNQKHSFGMKIRSDKFSHWEEGLQLQLPRVEDHFCSFLLFR